MNNQQTKFTSEKKAIASFVLGIISITPLWLIVFAIMVGYILSGSRPIYIYGDFIITLLNYAVTLGTVVISFASGVIGLILGIMGLKSAKRKYAITGIILSLIGLALFMTYIWIYY